MISKILLTSLVTFFLAGGTIAVTDHYDKQAPALIEVTEEISKAILYNGEIIPMIELPTVEITGKINTDDLVDAIEVDGGIYPSYTLEEVVITPGA